MKERTVMKYVAATLSIAIAIGPASALDVGLGGKVGGVGVGAGVGVGREGASLGGGASADGVGEANLGGSVGTGNGAPSASVGAGGDVDGVGGANLGGSVGTGNAAPSTSDGGSSGAAPAGSAGGSTAGSAGGSSAGSATNSSGASVGIGQSQGTRNTKVALPNALMPNFRIHPAAQPGAFRSRHIGAGYLGLSAVAQNRTEARHVKCGGAGLPAGDLLGGQAAWRRGRAGGQRRARAAGNATALPPRCRCKSTTGKRSVRQRSAVVSTPKAESSG